MKYYDLQKMLSYNALFNFLIGARGLGKTYGAKKFVIRDFIKDYKNQFVYVRRYKEELRKNNKFFNDIQIEFPEHDFKVEGSTYLIDKKPAGYSIALSIAKILKSVPFPDVKTIIFDEFIIDRGTYHYLPDEVMNFLELYETIARMRDVRVLFLSNAISQTNPYFLYFDLELPKAKNGIYRRGDILLELIRLDEFTDAKKQTRFGRIIEGTPYGEYAIDNKFLRDNDQFIARKTGESKYMFGFKYDGRLFGVWADYQAGRLTVSDDLDPSAPLVYTLTQADHTPNTMLIQQLGRAPLFKLFLDNYEKANVYFENMNIKNVCYQVFKLFHMR